MANKERRDKRGWRKKILYSILIAAAILFAEQTIVNANIFFAGNSGNGSVYGNQTFFIIGNGNIATSANNQTLTITNNNCPVDTYCYDTSNEVAFTANYNTTLYPYENTTYVQTQFIEEKA